METLLLVIMGIIGIALYSIVKARDFIADDTFSVAVLVQNNIKIWIWSVSVVALVAVTLFIEPKANDLIKEFVGLDLTNTKTGWLLFGAGLCGLFRNTKPKK